MKKGCFQGTKIDFSLPSVSHLAEKMIDLGKGAYMWTIDLTRAYRQLRICPLALPLLGLQNKDSYYIDICPSFGCRSSAYACARTTAAIVWLLTQQGITTFCYLDDFVGIATTLEQARKDYNTALSLLTYLGLEPALRKCIPPAQQITWLGFLLNTLTMTVSIPESKLKETLKETNSWMSREKTSKKQLQSLVGKLKHISSCIRS